MAGRECARCGISIDHRDKRSRHCSTRCRDRDYEGAAIGTTRACAQCCATFTATKGTHIYCTKQCRDRADLERNRHAYNQRNATRRARLRGARVGSAFTTHEVCDRDGWICQLCLAPIDWTLSGRRPLAPSVDHIIPINAGGAHALDNVWAAHFGCNARKSDRTDVVLLAVPGVA